MPSIFSRIVAGEIPAHKVAETEKYLAFLDINPVKRGHTLCIPKTEVDYVFDLDDDVYIGLMLFAKQVALGLKSAFACARVGVAVVGLEVPHAHVHLIPLDSVDDMRFDKPRTPPSAAELAQDAEAIRAKL